MTTVLTVDDVVNDGPIFELANEFVQTLKDKIKDVVWLRRVVLDGRENAVDLRKVAEHVQNGVENSFDQFTQAMFGNDIELDELANNLDRDVEKIRRNLDEDAEHLYDLRAAKSSARVIMRRIIGLVHDAIQRYPSVSNDLAIEDPPATFDVTDPDVVRATSAVERRWEAAEFETIALEAFCVLYQSDYDSLKPNGEIGTGLSRLPPPMLESTLPRGPRRDAAAALRAAFAQWDCDRQLRYVSNNPGDREDSFHVWQVNRAAHALADALADWRRVSE